MKYVVRETICRIQKTQNPLSLWTAFLLRTPYQYPSRLRKRTYTLLSDESFLAGLPSL